MDPYDAYPKSAYSLGDLAYKYENFGKNLFEPCICTFLYLKAHKDWRQIWNVALWL